MCDSHDRKFGGATELMNAGRYHARSGLAYNEDREIDEQQEMPTIARRRQRGADVLYDTASNIASQVSKRGSGTVRCGEGHKNEPGTGLVSATKIEMLC